MWLFLAQLLLNMPLTRAQTKIVSAGSMCRFGERVRVVAESSCCQGNRVARVYGLGSAVHADLFIRGERE